MKIPTTKTELDLKDLHQIITAHEYDRAKKIRLKGYFEGRHDILRKEGRANGAPNNKLVTNYCSYISAMSIGFFLGKPIAYTTIEENQAKLDILLDIFKYNDESAHNLELAEESSITGEAFELLYIDSDAEIRFKSVLSEEMIIVCDATLEENIIYAIRHYRIYDFYGATYSEYVDVYNAKEIRHYSYSGGRFEEVSESEANYFDDVPVIHYPNNKQCRGDFENVLTLVDAYNLAQSLTMDDLSDFTDAYLLLKGYSSDEKTAKELRKKKIISLDEGGGADWLIKNLNDTYIENLKTRLNTDIHKLSHVPDMSDKEFAGNASGVSIKYKLLGLELVRSRKEREFKKAIQRRIELISGMLKTKSKDTIDFRDVEITFTPNIPADNTEQAEIVKNLDGLVSQKKLLSLLSFVEDPVKEMEELKKEKEEADARLQDDYELGDDHEQEKPEILAEESD